MNFNRQDEKDKRNGGNDQDSGANRNYPDNPYGNYIPTEIPIPEMKGENTYQTQNTDSPYGQNNAYQPQNTDSPYGQYNHAYQSQNEDSPYGPQAQPYIPQKQKKGLAVKILIAAACVVVVVFAVVGIGMAYFRSTPTYKFAKAFLNLGKELEQSRNPLIEKIGIEDISLMMLEEGSHVSTQINFTSESMFGTTFGIDTECYKDVADKELSAETSISLMNYDFAHMNIYADEETFCFSIPELFMENMYIDNENVISQYNKSFLAEFSGFSDIDDFSLDFFPEPEERLSLREWKSLDSYSERFAEDIKACREKLVMEKVEKGLYRIVYPGREMEQLLQDLMESYDSVYELAGEEQWWKEYDRLIDSDISVLFVINQQNRIESIEFEDPVELLDGMASMKASLHFLGDKRSIDKIQGEISVNGADGIERSIHLQTIQTPTDDAYTFDMDIELMEEEDSILRMKYVSDSDAVRDEFDMSFSVWNDEDDVEMILQGSLDDIVTGRSLEFDLEEMTFNMDGEELFKITGEVLVEPFDGEVTTTVKKETAFFEMTEDDWFDILYEIDNAYGGWLSYLWY